MGICCWPEASSATVSSRKVAFHSALDMAGGATALSSMLRVGVVEREGVEL
jgi:hypothetical protein